jgi:hypothetical protein
MADRLLRALLDELMRELDPDATTPEPAPDPDPTPAPDGSDDPAADGVDQLMQQFMDELLRGLSPGGILDPFAPEGSTDSDGAQP